ncbi:hypothetical protein [Hyphomicrobium sp.]|uniref:hypothetical protein n=1 Tax=Hyphomicrobium sp. TaxID=82 RepID=UPI0025BC4D7E|nr:hypothetical protein [Hyphomicrobium sp.]MCC7250935.1 hypothetical protein [Hyphomicrobium sp.]
MKVAVGSRAYDGPWGGGNRFVAALTEALGVAGHRVVNDLADDDIDLILLTDPRVRSPNVCFGAGAILRYLAFRNPGAIVVHRVNECDERKGEAFINARLARANYCADATVFVGSWLARLPLWQRRLRDPWFTILNGADSRIFNADGFTPWDGRGPLKLVTHHWGYHPMKGFDVYRRIDELLDAEPWSERISFTYVGHLPRGFSFRNVRYVKPLDGAPLADELRSHHAYVTGSVNEPGGNHQNEGALCGLPLLYRASGCMPEYCSGFGVAYSGPGEIELALNRLIADYPTLVASMPDYPHTAKKMTSEWIALFKTLMDLRDDLVARRKLWRDPLAFAANQIPL